MCDYSSPLQKDLKRHEKTYGDIQDRPFKCRQPGCENSYTRSDNLSRHLQKKHAGIPDSLVSLDPTEMQFVSKGQTAASENNSMASMLVHPDGDRYQAESGIEPIHRSWYPESSHSSHVGSEQTTGPSLTLDPQLLYLRRSF